MRGRRERSISRGGISVLCACAISAFLQHCGGSTVGGASPASGGTSAGQSAQGGAAQGGAGQGGAGQGGATQGCATTMIDSQVNKPCTSDADCQAGSNCGEVVPGGYRTCLRNLVVNTKCSTQANLDACGCNGKTCPPGSQCVFAPATCGSGGTGPNLCDPGCTPGACPSGEVCIRGVQPVIGACYPAACRTDQDCGGCSRCAPYWTQLGCDGPGYFQGLKCTCRTDSDCKPGLHCGMGSGGSGGTTGFCL